MNENEFKVNVVLEKVLAVIMEKIENCRTDIISASIKKDDFKKRMYKNYSDAYLDIYCLLISEFGRCSNND